jgi:hypothetical protein
MILIGLNNKFSTKQLLSVRYTAKVSHLKINVIVVLQNCMDLPKVVPHSSTETYPTSSRDGNQVIDVKVEVTDIEEEGLMC